MRYERDGGSGYVWVINPNGAWLLNVAIRLKFEMYEFANFITKLSIGYDLEFEIAVFPLPPPSKGWKG